MKRSFEIISDEIDLSNFPPEQLPVVKRVIHATADFEFKNSLVFYPDAVRTGIEAIRAGKDILTDVEMVKAGINKKLLKNGAEKSFVKFKIQNSKFKIQKIKQKAETGIESALKENNNIGIIAIGNAPTALLKVIEIFNHSSLVTRHSSLVVGVPVGFVKALESKALLSTQRFPFITNLSRKGGSPVAAAIVNALLKVVC